MLVEEMENKKLEKFLKYCKKLIQVDKNVGYNMHVLNVILIGYILDFFL